MGVPGSANFLLAGAQGYQIERSLRFNSADSAYLNKNFGTPTNNIKWTWSGWVKRSALGSYQNLFCGDDGTSNNFLNFRISDNNDRIDCFQISGGSYNLQLVTDARFRDPSAWYHVVLIYDSANATSTDRVQIYVNGTRQTVSYPVGPFAQNTACQANVNSRSHAIGRVLFTSGNYLDGYLTEIHFIDGQALTPSSFGETDTITGVWKPKKYSGSGYGTNGFYLKFADNSGTTSTTLGKDSSGNGNNWTPNNFSVTAGAGNDSMIDTPTPYADGGNGRGNYCTLNPLDTPNVDPTLSEGNLKWVTNTTSGINFTKGSIYYPTSDKWYAEITIENYNTGSGVGYGAIGVGTISTSRYLWWLYSEAQVQIYTDSGYQNVGSVANNDIIQVAYDASTGKIWFGKNNTWYLSGNPSNGTAMSSAATMSSALGNTYFYLDGRTGSDTNRLIANFGQRPFAYTPPSGFLALNTQNLPEPSIKKPSSYFNAITYTGTGAARSVTGTGFQPDLVWTKNRSISASHGLIDAVRGAGKFLYSDGTSAEQTYATDFVSFDADGFSLGSGSGSVTNGNGNAMVAWQWKESATPGFDIVTYSGNGASPRSINHSLGVAPSFVVVKNRTTSGYEWPCYHTSLGTGKVIWLQLTNEADLITNRAYGGIDSVSSTTFTVKSGGTNGANVNANGDNYVAYLWSEVAGFSKFGSYTGNGSTDGPFVYCGFRPRWVMIKDSGGVNDWFVMDTSRSSYNTIVQYLSPNTASAEPSDLGGFDCLSNGFKVRQAGALNVSGRTLIFAAFAESPFKYSLAR